ncbi:MAG: sigma-70 family RNA polymerase sigma factor [Candidatus Eremiobacteraeota bacterium]|nr:sigma-70 family RNA polymerase sigma factor [Candidatus Eremiobacteraeota bacterium]
MNASLLLARVAAGDLAAFEALYDEYARVVYGVAMRILRNESAAEDVVQNVFMKLLSTPQAFRAGNFAAWIGRVARNRALDELRRGARTTDLSTFALGSEDAPLDDTVIAIVDAERVRGVVAALPVEQRTTIELAFFDGLTHHEIASTTGTPLGTVKTRIRAGLHAIRNALNMSLAQ